LHQVRLEPLGVGAILKTDNDVVGLCRLRDYADRVVNVLVRPLGVAADAA
jgi:hypothetical protein